MLLLFQFCKVCLNQIQYYLLPTGPVMILYIHNLTNTHQNVKEFLTAEAHSTYTAVCDAGAALLREGSIKWWKQALQEEAP